MKIKILEKEEEKTWDAYVQGHPNATLCHLSGWRKVIESTYGHRTYYLLAESEGSNSEPNITGVLPLVHIKSIFFGNSLVSMPFLNYGGILAENEQAGICLLDEAKRLGKRLGVDNIELRHSDPVPWMHSKEPKSSEDPSSFSGGIRKVRMVLELPESSERLFESFKSKLRSQIRKPQKEGLVAFIGGAELLDEFYHVFSINMRDLGSPVHSKKLFETMLKEFGQSVKLAVVKHKESSTAAGLAFCFRDGAEMIWASSLRKYNPLSPNMLLYWSLLEHVTNVRYNTFDFGRSTLDEGTYKFKEQWGAKPTFLHWYNISPNGKPADSGKYSEGGRLRQKGEMVWQKVPLCFANLVGPMIRKQIPL